MEFGRVQDDQINGIDFSLRPEPAFNEQVLRGTRADHPRLYLGCAKWDRPDWLGKLYPAKAKPKNFLDYYVQQYNSVELNATHYKIIGPAGITKWKEKARGRDFKFCPKIYQAITHKGNLKTKQFLTAEFLRGIAAFEENLGPVLIQFNENFTPKRKEELLTYLANLPKQFRYFIELRHPKWFASEKSLAELSESLGAAQIGFVITDAAGRRDCVHMHLSIPSSFIRFVGNGLHPTDFARCDAWVERIKYWYDRGMQELYFFMHMHNETSSPDLTIYLVENLNKACGFELIKPAFYNEAPPSLKKRGSLFNR